MTALRDLAARPRFPILWLTERRELVLEERDRRPIDSPRSFRLSLFSNRLLGDSFVSGRLSIAAYKGIKLDSAVFRIMGTGSNEQTSGTDLLKYDDDDFAPSEPSQRRGVVGGVIPFGFHSFRLLSVLHSRRRTAGADSESCFLRGRHARRTASTLLRLAALDERWTGLLLHTSVYNDSTVAFRYLRVGSRTRDAPVKSAFRPPAQSVCSTACAAGHDEACKSGCISRHVGVALHL